MNSFLEALVADAGHYHDVCDRFLSRASGDERRVIAALRRVIDETAKPEAFEPTAALFVAHRYRRTASLQLRLWRAAQRVRMNEGLGDRGLVISRRLKDCILEQGLADASFQPLRSFLTITERSFVPNVPPQTRTLDEAFKETAFPEAYVQSLRLIAEILSYQPSHALEIWELLLPERDPVFDGILRTIRATIQYAWSLTHYELTTELLGIAMHPVEYAHTLEAFVGLSVAIRHMCSPKQPSNIRRIGVLFKRILRESVILRQPGLERLEATLYLL